MLNDLALALGLSGKTGWSARRLKLYLGLGIACAGLLVLAAEVAGTAAALAARNPAWLQGIEASFIAGAATGLGAIAVLLIGRPEERNLPVFMALAGGMMFAAAVFSLIRPAIAAASAPWAIDVVLAVAAGYGLMALIDRSLPHAHPTPGRAPVGVRNALGLTVVAIAVHNVPEGFAVGAGFGGDASLGWATAVAIGVQNVPEGLIVALALWALGRSRVVAVLGALATGLVEPLGAFAGGLAAGMADAALPVALGLAGGAMLFVVLDELVPEAWRGSETRSVPLAFAIGFFALAALVGGL